MQKPSQASGNPATTIQLTSTRRRPWWHLRSQEAASESIGIPQNKKNSFNEKKDSELFPRIDTMQTLRNLQSQPPQGHDTSVVSSGTCDKEKTALLKEESLSKSKTTTVDVDAYYSDREMTLTQERMNALTMIPSPLYCLYYLLSGLWLTSEALVEDVTTGTHVSHLSGTPFSAVFADEHGCIRSSWFPNLHALPPLPLVMVALGIALHAPFSFIYHWKYAYQLGHGRIHHWSRRMDQAMIHAASAFVSYGTSGSWDFFLINLAFNLDCSYRLFCRVVHPKRSQVRIGISVVAYTLPLLMGDDPLLFGKVWLVMGCSFWIFAKYPFGGWSHSVFHIVTAFAVPLLMGAALSTAASQEPLRVAAACAVAKSNLDLTLK